MLVFIHENPSERVQSELRLCVHHTPHQQLFSTSLLTTRGIECPPQEGQGTSAQASRVETPSLHLDTRGHPPGK